MAYIQATRQISIKTPLGDDVLLFRKMIGFEQLGALFEYQVDLLSENKDIAFEDIVGKDVSVVLKLQPGDTREFNGIVCRFASTGSFGNLNYYQAIVRPWAWLLTRSTDCHIFQDKTVVEIVTEICQKGVYGGHAKISTALLGKVYPKLEYCVQYRETDFNFICRLMEQAGIYFFFKHEKGKHTMMLIDSASSHDPIPGYATIDYATDASRDQYGDERITNWVAAGEIQASGYELNDFDFRTAFNSVQGSLRVKESMPPAFGQPAYQQYDYPGGYQSAAVGHDLADARVEMLQGQTEQISATSNARGLTVGAMFALDKHPKAAFNRGYLVTLARYQLELDDYRGSDSGAGGKLFACQFEALGEKYRYRPPANAPKPRIFGPQTAMVVGKVGEEIWVDKYGRVKVQFHWDRVGKRDEKSSCWVRVSQSWAGKRWGAMAIPRIGMEVVVEFLDGDPDRPLITGCIYNSDTMPPYDLPAHQSRTTLKSHSTKGGDGFNEIRFEDKKGAEEIFVHAEKDANRIVKHNDTLKVGFEYKEPGSQTVDIKHDQKIDIGNDQIVHVVKDQTLTIDGNHSTRVGDTALVEAKTSILLKVGSSSILLEPAKITIKSVMFSFEASALAKITGNPVKLN
jgi:type VI secretion system secreted protein VgrG